MLWIVFAAFSIQACSSEKPTPEKSVATPHFVGSDTCQSCHQRQFDQWQGSHHQMAMQPATDTTVLGDFSNVTVPYFDTSATFFMRDDRYFVRTDNGDGEQQQFEVTHTFGVEPLQQYLVDAPGGRKQALQYTWDSRPASDGGQRWYHLYPDEYVNAADPLHWTGRYFNWNYMCAECHSTNLEMNYDLESHTFATTFSEVSVGCEACHGPASSHVQMANDSTANASFGFPDKLSSGEAYAWIMNLDTGIAERSTPASTSQQVESCGRCHSRRSPVATQYEYGKPLTDTHMPALLEEDLYHADGRILDEVYVYGSFVQSKMFAAGVTCADCHNPHSGKLHAGPDPNDTCSTCHLTEKFANSDHNEKQVGDCVSCHMPATTYMGVDDRRDHSFRLPDTAQDPNHYGAIIEAGREGGANDQLLAAIADAKYPAIARATMLTLLVLADDARAIEALVVQLTDPDPLLRIAAIRTLRTQAPDFAVDQGSHLLRDPNRSVRVEAALALVDYRDILEREDVQAFSEVASEYRQSMIMNASRPEAALALAEFESRLGNSNSASRMYEHAMQIGGDLAAVHHAYGLYKVRRGESNEALNHLRRAVELDESAAQFAYVYGVALNSLGQPHQAITVLESTLERFPKHFDVAWALATMYRDLGDIQAARSVASKLAGYHPNDQRVVSLLRALQN